MDSIKGFGSLLELFAAINFSLLAVHLASKESKGFHSIMIEWVSSYFKKLRKDLYEKSILAVYNNKFKSKLTSAVNKLDTCKNYLESTQGFSVSCLFAGLNCAIMLLLIGFKEAMTDINLLQPVFAVVNYVTLFCFLILFINDLLPVKAKLSRYTVKIHVVVLVYTVVFLLIGLIQYFFQILKMCYFVPVTITIAPLLLYLLRFFIGYWVTKFRFMYFIHKNENAFDCIAEGSTDDDLFSSVKEDNE